MITTLDTVTVVNNDYISNVSNKSDNIYDNIDGYIDGYVEDYSKKMYNRGQIMTIEERDTLNKWVNDLFINNILSPHDSRFSKSVRETDENIIPLFFEIKKRVEEKEKLSSFRYETSSLCDFITFIPKDEFIHKHTDPNEFQNNLVHIRFNVFITVPPNDTTYYNGHVVDAVECCYVLCRSGIDEHWSDVNTSDIPRISLSFGYALPPEKIDELTSDQMIGIYTQYYPLTTYYNKVKYIPLILKNGKDQYQCLSNVEERGQKGSSVFTISNIITEKQCDCLVDYIKNNSSIYERVPLSNNSNVECDFIRVTKTIPEFEIIDSFLFDVTKRILSKINDIQLRFKGEKDSGYTLRKIFGGTKQHIDGVNSKAGGFRNFVRSLSIIIVLNDDYEGGVFNFPNQKLKLRVKKGEAIFFPPYWTHPHSVTSVGEGQARYTFNTWILENFI